MVWFVLGQSGQWTSVKCAEAVWNHKVRGIVHKITCIFFLCVHFLWTSFWGNMSYYMELPQQTEMHFLQVALKDSTNNFWVWKYHDISSAGNLSKKLILTSGSPSGSFQLGFKCFTRELRCVETMYLGGKKNQFSHYLLNTLEFRWDGIYYLGKNSCNIHIICWTLGNSDGMGYII